MSTIFFRKIKAWHRRRGKRRLPMIFQSESSECGLACIAMVAAYYGRDITVSALRSRFAVSLRGLSLRGVLSTASSLGLTSRVCRCEPGDLRRITLPALLHWDLQHIVVLRRVSRDRFFILDPGHGPCSFTRAELSKRFTGFVVEMVPDEGFTKARQKSRLGIARQLTSFKAFKAVVCYILVLSAGLELLVLTQPLLIRSVVDTGLGSQDLGFIYRIIALLVIVGTLQGLANYFRDTAVLQAGTKLNFEMVQRVFQHALKLPLQFFEKRPIGLLIEQYRVIDEIERFIVSGLPLALIDGGMAIVSVTLLCFFSLPLGVLGLCTFATYFIGRGLTYQSMRAREQHLVLAKGEENGYLIETLKTIFTTKSNSIEQSRLGCWSGYYAALVKAQRQYGAMEIAQRSAKCFLITVNLAVLLCIATRSIAVSAMSLGSLFAILFYNSHFVIRSMTLVERFFAFKLLNVRFALLDDMMLHPTETEQQQEYGDKEIGCQRSMIFSESSQQHSATREVVVLGNIRATNLAFRYSIADEPVLRDLSFEIMSGDFVALVGHNGSGKTTLLKLLLGLYMPNTGEICFEHIPLKKIALPVLRSQIGVVTQEDQLFAGTVAENISLFDSEPDLHQISDCAGRAGIRQELEKLPMGYNTRVGHLGSPFSAGQTQKIFLARALYRRPAILMMDEGTANLDSASETEVLNNLEQLPITKLMIAHRSAAILRARRIFMLNNGLLYELSAREWLSRTSRRTPA